MPSLETSIDYENTLRIISKLTVADEVAVVGLARLDGGRLPDWTPGAHIDLVLQDGLIRQYSLCGDPFDSRRYLIAVRRDPLGVGSRFVHERLQVGDEVGFGGPRNNFRLAPAAHISFIAGGIGVTPILPMVRAADQLGAEWSLLYIGRERSGMAFLEQIEQAGSDATIHTTSASGRPDLGRWLQDRPRSSPLYVCGPSGLLDDISDLTSDWTPGRLRMERFSARVAGPPALTTAFEVELAKSGLIVTVEPDITVAAAIRSAGVGMLTSCAKGVCGTCETSVISGQPDHRDSLLDDRERESNDCMFPCVSRSRSARLVLDL